MAEGPLRIYWDSVKSVPVSTTLAETPIPLLPNQQQPSQILIQQTSGSVPICFRVGPSGAQLSYGEGPLTPENTEPIVVSIPTSGVNTHIQYLIGTGGGDLTIAAVPE